MPRELIGQVFQEKPMPFNLGTTELIIILVIVVLLFGAGRIGKLSGELGTSLRRFKRGLDGLDEENEATST